MPPFAPLHELRIKMPVSQIVAYLTWSWQSCSFPHGFHCPFLPLLSPCHYFHNNGGCHYCLLCCHGDEKEVRSFLSFVFVCRRVTTRCPNWPTWCVANVVVILLGYEQMRKTCQVYSKCVEQVPVVQFCNEIFQSELRNLPNGLMGYDFISVTNAPSLQQLCRTSTNQMYLRNLPSHPMGYDFISVTNAPSLQQLCRTSTNQNVRTRILGKWPYPQKGAAS